MRRFFGGVGAFYGSTLFAMVMGQTLYLRVDDATRADFEAAGSKPFSYTKKDRAVTVATYYEAPAALFDDPEELLAWARRAVEAALAANQKGGKRRAPKTRHRASPARK